MIWADVTVKNDDPDWLEQVDWNDQGLAPVITQDEQTGKVLTLAWMNREALRLTAAEGRAVYWSRSRGQIWRKGEQSGNVQKICSIRLDCDRDAILLRVEQIGGVACHTGREHCFFHELQGDRWEVTEPVLKDPKDMYGE